MPNLVKIIDKNHSLYGKILPGDRIFFDYLYTGDSPDIFQVFNGTGPSHRLLSTQIDEEHYEVQLKAKVIARLGADVGDMVNIQKTGSGSYSGDWVGSGPHEITKIDSSGHVEFDGGPSKGGASMFRPEVVLA